MRNRTEHEIILKQLIIADNSNIDPVEVDFFCCTISDIELLYNMNEKLFKLNCITLTEEEKLKLLN